MERTEVSLIYRIGKLQNDRYWIERPDGRFMQIDTNAKIVVKRLQHNEDPSFIAIEMDVDEEDISNLLEMLGIMEGQSFAIIEVDEEFTSSEGIKKDAITFYNPWIEKQWYRWGLFASIILSVFITITFIFSTPILLITGIKDQWIIVMFLTLAIFIHELGHFLSMPRTKNNSITIQWTGPIPLLSIVCNEAWKLSKPQRIRININGFLADILVCGFVSLLGLFIETLIPWIWSFLIIHMFRMFFAIFPLLAGDGYWLLVDIFNQPNLWKNAKSDLKQFKANWRSIYALTRMLFMALLWTLYLYIIILWTTRFIGSSLADIIQFLMHPAPLLLSLTTLYMFGSFFILIFKQIQRYQSVRSRAEIQKEKELGQ